MKRRVLVRKYVRAYYASHRPEMTRARGKMQQIWNRIGERYFRELERVFGPLSFYRPKHIQAKLSIFRCGVVDGNLRAFQIWYGTVGEPSEVRRHVAHEILHFYYYTYLKRRGYAKLSKDWDLAEIFNRIILNQPRLLRLTKKRDMGYSAHTRRVPKYRELWERSRGIEPYLQTLNRRAKGGE
ncbi:MAG: hypothetical protein ABI747_03695 [Candidatus Moraniibacteriota bacterium]